MFETVIDGVLADQLAAAQPVGDTFLELAPHVLVIADDESASDWISANTYRVTCSSYESDAIDFTGEHVAFVNYTQQQFNRFDVHPHVGDVYEFTAEGGGVIGIRLIERASDIQEQQR